MAFLMSMTTFYFVQLFLCVMEVEIELIRSHGINYSALLLFRIMRTVPTNPNKMKMESTIGMIIR